MKSPFFRLFGIPSKECKIEVRQDELGVPRLWFQSMGDSPVGLDLTSARQFRQLLIDFGKRKLAHEISEHITKAEHLSSHGETHSDTSA